jgi:hypothetical protein
MAIYSLDQNRFSFASAELDFGGFKVISVNDLVFKEESPQPEEYGNGPLPVGRVQGQYKGSGDCTILLVEYNDLIQRLGGGFSGKNFNVGATYMELQGDGIMIVDVRGARIVSHELANSEGKASRMKLSFSIVTPILFNGVGILGTSNGVGSIGASFGASVGISF